MSRFKDWITERKAIREAKRELSGKKTFFEWAKDTYMCFKAKREIKRLEKENKEGK
jgi:hypothetical protein